MDKGENFDLRESESSKEDEGEGEEERGGEREEEREEVLYEGESISRTLLLPFWESEGKQSELLGFSPVVNRDGVKEGEYKELNLIAKL